MTMRMVAKVPPLWMGKKTKKTKQVFSAFYFAHQKKMITFATYYATKVNTLAFHLDNNNNIIKFTEMKLYQQPNIKSAFPTLKSGVMQFNEGETASMPVGGGSVPPEEALAPKMKNLWEDDAE